jgi:hypothetical protein
MNAHVVFIPLIILSIWVTYGIWFKDWAKRNHKSGFIPGPQSLNAYIWTQRGLVLFGLIMLITFYILILYGVRF